MSVEHALDHDFDVSYSHELEPVLGALPGRKGHVLYDEAVPDWLIGCGVVWMDV